MQQQPQNLQVLSLFVNYCYC